MDNKEKDIRCWIDSASYEALLRRWRFSLVGDPTFTGELGKYYKKEIDKKRRELSFEQQVQASKNVGWEKI